MRMRAEGLLFFSLLFLLSTCSAFDISPSNPHPGDKITITGTATPGAEVNFKCSFAMDLPVSNGQYEYETSVEIPQKPNKLAVTAKNVKDMNLGVKMVIWITKRFEASGGTASISQSDVPPGRYNLKIFGTAADGASSVAVEVKAETAAVADSSGKYSLAIDTSGIPGGDYRIEGDGESKVIPLGGASSASSSGESSGSHADSGSSASPYVNENAQGLEITPDVIAWYAEGHGLDPKNTTQYAASKRQLEAMTSGGYWKVIARGDPLTEKAGNCDDQYCLVRGKDACITCRYEEMVAQEMAAKSNNLSHETNITAISENVTGNLTETIEAANNVTDVNATAPDNISSSQSAHGGKSFISSIIEWVVSIIGGWVR